MKQKHLALLSAGATLPLAAWAWYRYSKGSKKPLATVSRVDLKQYAGTWYEIARLPTPFEKGCYAAKAHYSLNSDGTVSVENICRKGGPTAPIEKVRGKAWVADGDSMGKLRVQFTWPFSAAYWIIELGNQYEYAVVGHPSRRFAWILSRTPTMDPNLYRELTLRLERDHGYDVHRLIKTPQPETEKLGQSRVG